jgi:hypothetical protein
MSIIPARSSSVDTAQSSRKPFIAAKGSCSSMAALKLLALGFRSASSQFSRGKLDHPEDQPGDGRKCSVLTTAIP